MARKYINNSRHLARKYARIFVRGHYVFREANSFPRAKLEENCELRGTGNVQGQISEHIFAPNGGYCLYYPSNLFGKACSNWGIFLKQLFHERALDMRWSIANEARRAELARTNLISNKREWNNCFIKNAPKYRKLNENKGRFRRYDFVAYNKLTTSLRQVYDIVSEL